MDYLLYLKLRHWAKRKTQTAKAGTEKYWRQVGNWKYVFATEIYGKGKEKNKIKLIELHQYTDFAKSLRNEYVKVRGETSPFDGNELYWASRLGRSPFMSKTQAALLKAQKGRCKLCMGMFTTEDIMEIDHIDPLGKGGGKDNCQSSIIT